MKYFSYILFLFLSLRSYAQNLVPNPSFEQYDTCPNTNDDVSLATYWSGYGAYEGSPDYFNRCADISSTVSVPSNGVGYQEPATGNAYTGLITFHKFLPDYREIIGVTLTQPLSVGQAYYVSFKTSAGYTYFGDTESEYANKLGAKFSMMEYNEFSNPAPVDNISHVYTNTIITDTTNWVSIQGTFTADAAYPYLMLGNFFDDAHTSIVNSETQIAYYYIDDVCVSTDSTVCGFISTPAFVMPSAFSPNGDNTNETYFPVHYSSLLAIREFRIYNRWGQLLYNNPNAAWDGNYKNEPQPVDTYTYYIYIDIPNPDNPNQQKAMKKQGSFTLLR